MLAAGTEADPWAAQDGNLNLNTLQQREQRQRSIRFLMMFLLMLTLMDGEEAQRRRGPDNFNLRSKRKGPRDGPLEHNLYMARRRQDDKLERLLSQHPRYKNLLEKNKGKDYDKEVRLWAEQQPELQKDEFTQGLLLADQPVQQQSQSQDGLPNNKDPVEEAKVLHYPWNVTGFYRGEWSRNVTGTSSSETTTDAAATTKDNTAESASTARRIPKRRAVQALEIEPQMIQRLRDRGDSVGVLLLPDDLQLNISNSSSNGALGVGGDGDEASTNKRLVSHQPTFLRGATLVTEEDSSIKTNQVTLTKTSGRAAFQLYSRSVPAIKEISIVDGFVKLYDSNTMGYSTRRDILLRVTGVVIHSLGVVSLVSSPSPARAAFVVLGEDDETQQAKSQRRRRLQQALENTNNNPTATEQLSIEQIREDALSLYPPGELSPDGPTDPNYNSAILSLDTGSDENRDLVVVQNRRLAATAVANVTLVGNSTVEAEAKSNVVFPFPFVMDDKTQSIGRTRTPAARSMPPREQLLEANAGSCEFEMNLLIREEQWTVGQWRALLARHVKEAAKLDPSAQETQEEETSKEKTKTSKKSSRSATSRRLPQDQALVMTLNGTIISSNCDFRAEINATAVRTDWEHTTGKAINYSFYMMLTCLTQIVLLLRQLLHSQSQSAATRVSLLCIGWQTVLDALLCLVHIYLSLAMQPLFTAFASVAFFKLLIFCVIEMKYMAIIIQARNSTNGGNTLDLLRRQIAMLHLRFYVALLGSFIAFFYAWESYRTLYMLLLYSFWVPQIVYNVVTEAKRPLHHYYVYGMSLTRLVAPLYIFAVKNNFLKEVYPDSPTSYFMCEMLVLWVGIQTAVLEAQGRYGARFMIPARFLPPKFDYNRPIPPSLLPQDAPEDEAPSVSLHKDRAQPEMSATLITRESSSPRRGARNRMKGSRVAETTAMTTETISSTSAPRPLPSFDCVICYNEIDIRNRTGYMLAPCDHLFHKDCLVQWMEVKMECPICRKDLPAL